jgi:hypothetical protein
MCSLIGDVKSLIKELDIKFQAHGVMDVLGIVMHLLPITLKFFK